MSPGGSHSWRPASIPMIEPEYLAEVLGAASDIALVVDADGTVQSALVNQTTTAYGTLEHWEQKPLVEFLTRESVDKFKCLLKSATSDSPLPRHLELNHQDEFAWQFPVRYSAYQIGTERLILMMGRDLRQIAESQQQLVQAQVALERGYEEKREFDARYRMLLTATRDAFVVLSTSDGRIRDLNAAAATLLGASRDELQGAAFAQEFKDRRRTEFSENLISLAQSDNDSSVAMEAKRTRRNLTLTPTAFRVSGEQMIICRLDTETAAHASNDRLSTNLNALFRSGTDAIVFTDTKGLIDAANEAFLEMVDFGHQSDVRGRNLSEYMARGQIDLDALLENALRSGHMRVYSTKLSNDMGVWTSVEMSVTYLQDGTRPSVAFTIRDVTRAEALRVPATNSGPAAAGNSAVDLVGQAPLKEIVAATSDVVEKMCIETAIELTRNNRAAAAEMLGLSRQSLYVKLRKFGLLDKSDAD